MLQISPLANPDSKSPITNPHFLMILIIDDDPRNVFALTAVLKAKGYSCLSAQGMPEAFEILAQRTDIGIILMDMMMPEMDGYEAIPRIREKQQWRHIPIIAVTAQAMKGDRERCLAAGATDYLPKPVDTTALEKALAVHLRRHD